MTAPKPANPHRKLLLTLGGVVLGMFGFAFALVPLYDAFCRITGLNGKGANTEAVAPLDHVDTSRRIRVQFVARVDAGIPWEFGPEIHQLEVYPGEVVEVNFLAQNRAGESVTGQAVPSITPGLASAHFKKTECFCFNQQILQAGEQVKMPVRFFIDPALPDKYGTVTLSYTLYNATQQAETAVADNQIRN